MQPDVCIMNFYSVESRMGVHQDKDESQASIAAGAPIVSVSLGDAARFVVGGLTRREPTRPIVLRSGDVPGDGRCIAPPISRRHGDSPGYRAGGNRAGRFNLTFRQC